MASGYRSAGSSSHRSTSTSRHPSAASAVAVAAPIPRAPPVTIATGGSVMAPTRTRPTITRSRSATRASRICSPSAAEAPVGSPRTPLGDTAAHAAGAQRGHQLGQRRGGARLGPVEAHGGAGRGPAAGRSRCARRGRRRRGCGATRPRPAGPRPAARPRPGPAARRCRRGPTPAPPPAKASAERTSSTTTRSRASWPIDSVPAKPACSPLDP